MNTAIHPSGVLLFVLTTLISILTLPTCANDHLVAPKLQNLPTSVIEAHFSGADGSFFHFTGEPNKTYCVLTDSHVHINGLFGGYVAPLRGKIYNAISQVGILWGEHQILLRARQGPGLGYLKTYLKSVQVNGQVVSLPRVGDTVAITDDMASISWLSAKRKNSGDNVDVYAIDIPDVMSLVLELHLEPSGNVHFDLYLPFTYLSDNVHGILGQTFRSDHADRLSRLSLEYSSELNRYEVPPGDGGGYLDGSVNDYETSSIAEADCKFCRFAQLSDLDVGATLAMEGKVGVVSVVHSLAEKVLTKGASRRLLDGV